MNEARLTGVKKGIKCLFDFAHLLYMVDLQIKGDIRSTAVLEF